MRNKADILKKRIGVRVKTARQIAKLTQQQLAEAADRSVEAISNIERGASLPPLDTLGKLAEKLNVQVSDFFDTVGSNQSIRREEIETLIRLQLRDLDDDKAETALKLIDALSSSSK